MRVTQDEIQEASVGKVDAEVDGWMVGWLIHPIYAPCNHV